MLKFLILLGICLLFLGLFLFITKKPEKIIKKTSYEDAVNNLKTLTIMKINHIVQENGQYDTDKFMVDFKKTFKDNITKQSICLLEYIKKQKGKTDSQIADMTIYDILDIFDVNDIYCPADRQLSFIEMVLIKSRGYPDHNKLFDFAKNNIDDTVLDE